jgi:catechol 2,3-dioxygenase-like lactoylglutathione lyase family enzyme
LSQDPEHPRPDHPRGIDHLVLAVRDLDGAARLYGAMGFQVGARNRHPWGTENRIVQFPGTFLELITVGEGAEIPPHGPGVFSFGAFVAEYLARREGLAMLVLDGPDGEADARAFAEAGIGAFAPFRFERRARRPDGSDGPVAFTLAFARDEGAPGAGFFTCRQHHPENFWNEGFQRHPNGATGIDVAVLAAPDPAARRPFLEAFTGVSATSPAGRDLSFRLARGRVDVLTPDDAAEAYGSIEADPNAPEFAAFAVRVPDVAAVARSLAAAGIPHQAMGSRTVVPASAAHGVAVAFEGSVR